MKISSIVIAKNEEKNIRRCIESQIPCIDDIVVLVDEDSKDGTLEIVKNYQKVRYEIVRWEGFAKTKQRAVELTLNDWVFWIDADEEITPELNNELNTFKSTEPGFSAYSVSRRAYFLGKWIKHSGWYPGRVTRLFDKKNAKFNDNKVHEHLNVIGKIGNLNNDLIHYTDPSIEHYFEKFNKYTSLAAIDLANKKKDYSILDILFRPLFIFTKMYILKLGFLDGVQGFILAVFSSAYVFTKYSKLWELTKKR